ncbi:MAG: hypothetical protein SFU99_08850 [Saprospiraceae bacterium]|nr:hypothetical protein [Saprospiraceae bacterium]
MYKFFSKNGQLIGFGLGALVSALFLISWLSGNAAFQAMAKEDQPNTGIFDAGLIGSFVLFIMALLALVGFGVFQTASNFRNSIKGLIGIAVLVAIFLITYSTSSVESTGVVADAAKKMGTSDNTQKLIGGGLITMIILSVVAIGALVLSEIRNFFK